MVAGLESLVRELVGQSEELVEISPGWRVSRWAEVAITDRSGELPRVVARASLVGPASHPRAVVQSVKVDNGSEPLKAAHIYALGRVMPDLPALVLSMAWVHFEGSAHGTSTPEAFAKALRSAGQRNRRGLVDTEDKALTLWENKFQPKGMSQREAAEQMRLAYPTFRSYLSRARARRGK